jgi:hypothetical protein
VSAEDGVLVAVLKRAPFDAILSGEKLEEYREQSDYWVRRLFYQPHGGFRHYHTLRAFHGYGRDRRVLEIPIKRIRMGVARPEWTFGIISTSLVFVIELDPVRYTVE